MIRIGKKPGTYWHEDKWGRPTRSYGYNDYGLIDSHTFITIKNFQEFGKHYNLEKVSESLSESLELFIKDNPDLFAEEAYTPNRNGLLDTLTIMGCRFKPEYWERFISFVNKNTAFELMGAGMYLYQLQGLLKESGGNSGWEMNILDKNWEDWKRIMIFLGDESYFRWTWQDILKTQLWYRPQAYVLTKYYGFLGLFKKKQKV